MATIDLDIYYSTSLKEEKKRKRDDLEDQINILKEREQRFKKRRSEAVAANHELLLENKKILLENKKILLENKELSFENEELSLENKIRRKRINQLAYENDNLKLYIKELEKIHETKNRCEIQFSNYYKKQFEENIKNILNNDKLVGCAKHIVLKNNNIYCLRELIGKYEKIQKCFYHNVKFLQQKYKNI